MRKPFPLTSGVQKKKKCSRSLSPEEIRKFSRIKVLRNAAPHPTSRIVHGMSSRCFYGSCVLESN